MTLAKTTGKHRGLSTWTRAAVSTALLATIGSGFTASVQAADKLQVYVSFGYYGNSWMKGNRNMMTAFANSPEYKDKVDLHVQVVDNGDAQRQSQQINAMIVITSYSIHYTKLYEFRW